MDLSICVVNWNVRDYLGNCLQSIYNNTNGLSFEVIVVDNHSKDGSREMVREKFPQVKLIENQRNLGFPTANNQAIKEAKGRYLLFLNPDTVVFPSTLEGMVEFMDRYPEAGIATCTKINSEGSQILQGFHPLSLGFFATLRYISWRHLFQKFPHQTIIKNRFLTSLMLFSPKIEQDTFPFEVNFAAGCFLMVRQEIIRQIGSFDERFFHYFDDNDFCYRVKKQGWKVYYHPGFKIMHFIQKSMEQWDSNSQLEIKNFSHLLFYRKYKGKIKLFLWVLGKIILIFLIVCVRLIFNPIPSKIKFTPIKEEVTVGAVILSHIRNLFRVLMGISPRFSQYE